MSTDIDGNGFNQLGTGADVEVAPGETNGTWTITFSNVSQSNTEGIPVEPVLLPVIDPNPRQSTV